MHCIDGIDVIVGRADLSSSFFVEIQDLENLNT